MLQLSGRPRLVYEIPRGSDDWVLTEDKVPESRPHDLVSDRAKGLFQEWGRRTGRRIAVCRNLAVRWDEDRPAIGVDPDVCILEPPPPACDEMFSLKLWESGCMPPILALEIVSQSRIDKDYSVSPAKYAANGTRELWVFDPKLVGPKTFGERFRLQVWRRDGEGSFLRVYAGEGPAWSETLQAWVFATGEGRSLGIADDEEGTSWWMTGQEAERAAKEAERAAKEAAEARAERLAAKLRALGVDPESLR